MARVQGVIILGGLLALLLASNGLQHAPPAEAIPQFYTVDTTSDANLTDCTFLASDCSLRGAINRANGNSGADTIDFALGAGTPSISVGSTVLGGLPQVTDPLTINGNTGGATRVELNGTSAGTGLDGIALWVGVTGGGSTIQGLVINRFSNEGIRLSSDNNIVKNSLIGTDSSGTVDLSAAFFGIDISGGSGNVIGGTSAGDRNVVSGNQGGIITGGGSNNAVLGNYIGTTAAGDGDLGNSGYGMRIADGPNCVGGTIVNSQCTAVAGGGNVISGNDSGGLLLVGPANRVVGNHIGTDASGTAALPNLSSGVEIAGDNNTLGSTTAAGRNVISGNSGHGVWVNGLSPERNSVIGNYIGLNATGTAAIGNTSDGVRLENNVSFQCIGSLVAAGFCAVTSGARNVISGNLSDGIEITSTSNGNGIMGNYIGTNGAGTGDLGNAGVGIRAESDNNAIGSDPVGGEGAAHRNVISGNNGGIVLSNGANGNVIQHNYMGPDVGGSGEVMTNGVGVMVSAGAGNNTIGPFNLISDNTNGVEISGSATNGTAVKANRIGTDPTGTASVPNSGYGVLVSDASGNTIGGTGAIDSNTIAFNSLDGVRVSGATATGNAIRRNSIHSNGGLGIENIGGGNTELSPPVITSVGSAAGTACANCTVDVFSDDANEGRTYHGSATADGSGNWSFPGAVTGPRVTATATNAGGNTSEFTVFAGPPQTGPVFTVNSTDPDDDGVCHQFWDCTLREAINAANADGLASTVVLGNSQTYPLTLLDNTGNGLPVITTDITVNGNGSTIQRSTTTRFRIFQVNSGAALTLNQLTISGGNPPNGPGGSGGGISSTGATLTINNSTISGNTAGNGAVGSNGGAGGHGGGIFVSGGTVSITNSTLSGNTAGTGGRGTNAGGGVGGGGGGVYVGGGSTTNITSSTISGNTAGTGGQGGPNGFGAPGGSGGGVNGPSGTHSIANTTITGNTAGNADGGSPNGGGSGGSGGGIYSAPSTFTLTNSTLSGSGAGFAEFGGTNGAGGGIASGFSTNVKNTVVASSTSGGNCDGFFATTTSNLSTDATCLGAFTQKTPAEINLVPLANNGGPTQTMALIPPSAAIDAGDNATCAAAPVNNVDQRGAWRPLDGDGTGGATCDIGAYEHCPASSDCDGDGFTDAAEASIGTGALDPCGNNGWPGDLLTDNRLNIGDFNSFLFPLRDLNGNTVPGEPAPFPTGDNDGHGVFNYFGHTVSDANISGVERWNLIGGPDINIGDLNALNPAVLAPTAAPPMFGGLPAFFTNVGNGVGGCPFPP